jgi:hypothetical protein
MIGRLYSIGMHILEDFLLDMMKTEKLKGILPTNKPT